MRVRNQRFSSIVALIISAAAVVYVGRPLPLWAQSANSGTVTESLPTRAAPL